LLQCYCPLAESVEVDGVIGKVGQGRFGGVTDDESVEEKERPVM
jgi:hypothetical protein